MNFFNVLRKHAFLLPSIVVFIGLFFTTPANAIDNPDAPDLIAEFEAREKPLIKKAHEAAGYNPGIIAYRDYLNFLDKELNVIYKTLHAKLPAEQQRQLKQSQLAWLKHRDLEFSLIDNTWKQPDFGSSSSITRGQFKASLIRSRIIQLMHYARA